MAKRWVLDLVGFGLECNRETLNKQNSTSHIKLKAEAKKKKKEKYGK